MKIFNSLIIFCYLIKKFLNYIVYPLKVYNELNCIENFLLFNSTYTTLEIGTPPQKVNFGFNLNHSKMFISDVGCQNTNLFNSIESSSLFILPEPEEENNPYNNRFIAFESFYFYNNINLSEIIQIDEYPIYYSVDLRNEQTYLCGNIGLSIMQNENFGENDEIEYYLNYARSQNKYFSFFNYKGKDFLISNVFLHQEFKDIIKDVNNISWINPIMRDNILHWEIYMKELYYSDIHIKDKIIFEINPLFELIIGNNDYKKNIEKIFFNSYLNNKICIIKQINNYQIFICESNKFTLKDIKNFPKLFMHNIDINYIFEMNGEELFIKLNNKYYFKIIFPIKSLPNNKWIIGKIFLRKYPVIFSPSNKLIGFYITPYENIIDEKEEKETNNKQLENDKNIFSKNILLYIEIIIIALIFTCIGLFIAKKIFLNRRRKVNELFDDYYQYKTSYKKDTNNQDLNKNNNSFTSIEMNSKLGSNI